MWASRGSHAWGVVLVVAALSACVESGSRVCADDSICPPSLVCAPAGGCVDPDLLAACAGRQEGDACEIDPAVQGECRDGACQLVSCGDGVIDSGEVCDDGNDQSGDGCRGDCRKLEECGDALVDVGEDCDDGNANPVDGCDSCVAIRWEPEVVLGADTLNAGLFTPGSLAVDPFGNLYIAELIGNRIRRIDADTGEVSVVAGTGTQGFSGDGGQATAAEFQNPRGIAVDGVGNLFIADAANNRIRKVDGLTGVISTVVGVGTFGNSGDGGPAVSAELAHPSGIAIDGLGDLYISDGLNGSIRHVDAGTGIITTIAGVGTFGLSGDGGPATSAELSFPSGLTVDASGNVFVADEANHRIRRIDAVSGIITTVVGTGDGFAGDGGPATAAQLSNPSRVRIAQNGDLIVCDLGNNRVRRVAFTTGVIETIVGNGSAGSSGDGGLAIDAELNGPQGIELGPDGDLFIAEVTGDVVRRVDSATGIITTAAGTGIVGSTGNGGPATSARLQLPTGAALDAAGNLYIADRNDHQVRRVDAQTGTITIYTGSGTLGFAGDGGPAVLAELNGPFDVAIDGQGDVYIADRSNHRVRRVEASTGIITTVAGTGASGFAGDNGLATAAELSFPVGVDVDSDGNVYIADRGNHRIRRIDTAGVITTVAGTGLSGFTGDNVLATTSRLNFPESVTVDAAANVFIGDKLNHRIRRVDAQTGIITTVAGNGVEGGGGDGGLATDAELATPRGVAIDTNGDLYIADSDNHRIRRVSATDGVITTVAGNGTLDFSGDGGPAADALLENPHAVVLDPAGNLYVADSNNRRVRLVDRDTSVITTVAGDIDPDGMGAAAEAVLADPRALASSPDIVFFAGGTTGTVQALDLGAQRLDAVVGRYPQSVPTADLARYRDGQFGAVHGVAHDADSQLVYLSESTNHRIQVVSVSDPDPANWTIATLAGDGIEGFADGALADARFREPAGLFWDASVRVLYVADAGNHVIRAIDLDAQQVSTVAGTPETLGFFGDGLSATSALLFRPGAVTRCPGGDMFIADTLNHRLRRISVDGTIETVLGDGTAASSGQGVPAREFPIDGPLGLACDGLGNLFATSKNAMRLLPADDAGVVDGTGPVLTIFGAPSSTAFPETVTSCLTGLVVVDATTVRTTDACTGMLIDLHLVAGE